MVGILIFPYLSRRFNIRKMYITAMSAFILAFALMPLGNLAARTRWVLGNAEKNARVRGAMTWMAIGAILAPVRVAVLCYMYVELSDLLNRWVDCVLTDPLLLLTA